MHSPLSCVHSKGLMWQMMEDLSTAANVSLQRLNVYKVESNAPMPGMKAYLAIYTSPASGSGIPGIDPIGSRDIAEDLIAQVNLMFSPIAAESCKGEFHLSMVCVLHREKCFCFAYKIEKKPTFLLFAALMCRGAIREASSAPFGHR